MIAVCVDPARINDFWPHFKHWIKRAIDKIGMSSFAEVERNVIEGESQFWLAWDGQKVHAAAVTQLVHGSCEIIACGGEGIKSFLCCLETIEQFARDEGCKTVRVIGRGGWIRVLKDYEKKAVILERRL